MKYERGFFIVDFQLGVFARLQLKSLGKMALCLLLLFRQGKYLCRNHRRQPA